MASPRSSEWYVHCRNCGSRIIGTSRLTLTLLGSAGVHVKLKREAESEIENTTEKVQNPKPKNRDRTPFKALCRGSVPGEMCRQSLGAYTKGGLCFSADKVFFRTGHRKLEWKKWSDAKDDLERVIGILVVTVSSVATDGVPLPGVSSGATRRESLPLVYCDVTLTSDNIINRLTRDRPRDYQRELFKKAMEGNSLVYLSTGCGKTLVAAMAIACMKHLNCEKLAVFLAPKTPLVQQQFVYLKRQLPGLRIRCLTGDSGNAPGDKLPWIQMKNAVVEQTVDVVVLSPQIFLNFLEDESKFLRMSDVSVIVFDEAHNCLGSHPYAKIMEFYALVPDKCKPLVLALTASPTSGMEMKKIEPQLNKLLETLHCRAVIPGSGSNDLKRFWNRPETSYLLKELNKFQRFLEMQLENYMKSLNPLWMELLQTSELQSHAIQSSNYKGILRNAITDSQNNPHRNRGLALAEHAMTILSTLEVNKVLGCDQACTSLQSIFSTIEKAENPMNALRKDVLGTRYKTVLDAVYRLRQKSREVGAMSDRFQQLVTELRRFAEKVRRGDETCRGIVFVKMRKTCTKLCEELNKDPLVREFLKPKKFVGHGKGMFGMEWREDQEPTLKEFHSGKCKLLVSTSVLEEGLDVPACNLVVRFDSVMSMRALVQSRGRAARRPDSRFVVMCNDLEELNTFQEMEKKEMNVETAMSRQARHGIVTVRTADTRGCVIRKLDAKQVKISYKNQSSKFNKKKRRRRKKVPARVTITVHLETKNEARNYRPVSAQDEHDSAGLEAKDFFRKKFQIIPNRTETLRTTESPGIDPYPTVGEQFTLEAPQGSGIRTDDELFYDVLRLWYENVPNGSWLEKSDRRTHARRMVFHILPIEILSGGDFKDRGTFSELWEHDCQHKAEIIFLHDLKIVTIVFYSSSGTLHKIEFRYDQLHEFLVVDPGQRDEEYANLFLCLRHVPQLSAAESFVSPMSDEAAECSFSEYFLRGDESDDDVTENSEGAQGQSSRQPTEESSEESSEEDANVELFPTNLVNHQSDLGLAELVLESESDADHEDDPDMDSVSENEDLSFFPERTSAVDEMVWVKVWSRRYQIDDNVSPFGKFLSLRIQLPFSLDLCDALGALTSFGKRIFYSPVKIEDQFLELARIASFSFDVWYAHDCLINLHLNVRPRLTEFFYTLLRILADQNPDKCVSAIYQISSVLEHDYFADPESEVLSLIGGNHVRRAYIPHSSVPANCSLVKRLVLTPTRVIPFPPEIMEQNRVLRHFDSSNFLCVNVREEDYSKLRGHKATLDEVLQRIKALLDSGISVGGLLYDFVGCSNSQMRSHGCWFVHQTERANARSIREWMGDFSEIRCVASYMSRLGQCFSTSLDTIGITMEEGVELRRIADVKRDGYCFSDGIGTISPFLAKEVCKRVGKPTSRSALQIRFAGCKGVLCQDPSLPENCICIRPSMDKFESNHRRLELLQTSRPQAVYLNHQTIMLLSNLGVPDEIFLDLQRKMLDGFAAMMLNEQEALQRMSNVIKTGINYKALADVGVSLTTEPYFKSLLCALYKAQINRLLKKSRILLPVAEARLMMGVMDETGTLEYGQVFVQCSHMNSEGDGEDDDDMQLPGQQFIVQGRVMVTRNPCLHPGDVRQLQAVDVPELCHLVDCIVFPKNGPRPHPNEMAGGDLDGDLYFVTWSDSFKPRKETYEPMKYPALAKMEKDGPITVDDMTTFFTEYLQSEVLGIIDNAHKAAADLEENGVESQRCIRLAEAHSLAVDAPKTGMWPACPDGAPAENPDFMMNPTKPSYVSQKLLGKLFRECRDFEETMNHVLPLTGVELDRRFLFPGYCEYLESAAIAYEEYASQVNTLMRLYAIKSEGELMSGCFHKLRGDFGRERSQIAVVVRRLLQQLRTSFRATFFEEFQKNGEMLTPNQVTPAMKRKASAWYHHVYKPVAHPEHNGRSSSKLVSFPWVVDDVLVAVLCSGGRLSRVAEPINNEAMSNVARSVNELFARDAPALVSGYKARMELLKLVSRAINANTSGWHLVMFGSSASLLFRPTSDLDLCVLTPLSRDGRAQSKQVQTLQNLEPILRQAFGEVKLIKDAKVPVIRLGRLKNPSSRRLKLSCDVSADSNGFMKTTVLLAYFEHYPWLLPLLRLIIRWAYSAGLTNRVEGVRINTNVLVFMLLSFCVQSGYIECIHMKKIFENFPNNTNWHNVEANFWERLIALIKRREQETVPIVGGILLEFFEKRQKVLYGSIPENFRTLLDATTFLELLSTEDVQILREQMQKAYHVLAVHGNGQTLIEISSSHVQRTFTLSHVQSAVIAGAERSHSRDLSRRSGAEVTIRPQLPGSGRGLILEARGTIGTIRVLERLLSAQKKEYAQNKISAMSKCFVRGASMITFEGCHSDRDHVTLVPYSGNHHQNHDQRIRYVPLLDNQRALSNGGSEDSYIFQSFREKFLKQINVVNRDYDPEIHGKLEFVVHFGRIYVFDIPRDLSEDSEPIFVRDLQYAYDKGLNTRPQGIRSATMRFKKPRGSGQAKVKAERKKKTKDSKREVDKSPNHSLFTVIRYACVGNIKDYLERKGYEEQRERTEETFVATVHVGSKDFYVCYDSNVQPTSFRLPRLRWFLADIKRPWNVIDFWRARVRARDSLDGPECDVRLMLGTSREYTRDEVHAGDYEKFLSILEPSPVNSSPYPFKVLEDLRSKLLLVRRKETVVYTRVLSGTDVFLSEITEYSRLKATGEFKKVFIRHELVVKPAIPSNWENIDEVDRFLTKIWKLAFRLAKIASKGIQS